jgi:rhodanese-related sulfurtransferase
MEVPLNTILPSEVKKRLSQGEQLNIIDVREDEEVAQGAIQGSRHIPLGQLPERYQEIDRTHEIILVCRSGGRSSRAYEFLQMLGITGLKNMTGGMLAWDQD